MTSNYTQSPIDSFRVNSCNSWTTLPLHPHSLAGWRNSKTALIRFLIEKPAVVFIGEARENQLPISFRENSCN